jgi:hypothetical protein
MIGIARTNNLPKRPPGITILQKLIPHGVTFAGPVYNVAHILAGSVLKQKVNEKF